MIKLSFTKPLLRVLKICNIANPDSVLTPFAPKLTWKMEGVAGYPAVVGSIPRKRLTAHRTLFKNVQKRCAAALQVCKTNDNFLTKSMNFCRQRAAYETFLNALKALKYDESFYELSDELMDTLQKHCKAFEACKSFICGGF